MLTPTGRELGERLVGDEVRRVGVTDELTAGYARFLTLNLELLEVCSAWQVRQDGSDQQVNDHSDPVYDAEVLARLAALHDDVVPVLAALTGALARFGRYEPRLSDALARARAGDVAYVTGIRVPSYHTVWFELHEDLLASLGVSREEEAAR